MRTLFHSQGLWELVQEGPLLPTNGKEKKAEASYLQSKAEILMRDSKALMLIQQGVTKIIFPRIMSAETAKEAWDILQEEYKGSAKVIAMKLQTLWSDLDTVSMKSGEPVQEFLARVVNLINQIRNLGNTVENRQIVPKLLRSLPSIFNPAVTTIEESKDIYKLPLTELMASLKSHEDRLARNSQNINQALQMKMKLSKPVDYQKRNDYQKPVQQRDNRGKQNWNSGIRGRGKAPTSFQDKNVVSSPTYCIICNKTTHNSRDCYSKCKRCKIPNHSDRECWHKDTVKFVDKGKIEETGKETLFYSCLKTECKLSRTWYIDSGCSSHMAYKKETFATLDETHKAEVYLGDGKASKLEGKGSINIITSSGQVKQITDVQFVPKLAQNLLSVGQLLQKGYNVSFSQNLCSITDQASGALIVSAQMGKNRVFPLDLPISNLDVALTCQQGCSSSKLLWHHRLGHLHWDAINIMKTKELVTGLPELSKQTMFYPSCAKGKAHKTPFPVQLERKSNSPLEMIHDDLWGPTTTKSIRGKSYYFLLVDDFSKYMWIYFLSHKSEAFQVFKTFKLEVENQFNQKIKSFRTDRGGEFTSSQFQTFCRENGIRRQLTAPYSLQQNGAVERRNRTVAEMGRIMLLHKNLPKEFWAEAVNTAVYILNRVTTRSLQDSTPYEQLFQRKPSVTHLRTFKCTAYALLHKGREEKLDRKSNEYIFIRYSDQSKAYRLYQPEARKLTISRDVIFNEEGEWPWDSAEHNTIPQMRVVDSSQVYESIQPLQTEHESIQPLQTEHESIQPQQVEDSASDSGSEASSSQNTHSLEDIYQTSDLALSCIAPATFEEANQSQEWRIAITEEMNMIN
ncbi:hypothetical protein KSP39_PZI015880 [Platanthera zijinensis]|uniref:Integrase catalytic domain-containing protein n=1 Tax=Platanthera zijinensis TaxID=2320716 RepID=A0AAP0G1E6_9ASPA